MAVHNFMNAFRKQANANAKQSQNQKINREKPKWTDVVGLGVNIILAAFTALLFWKTREANQTSSNALIAAQKANDIADSARRDSKDQFERTMRMAEAAARANDTENAFSRIQSERSLQAQINSIKEMQRQFDVANTPFIQMTHLQAPVLREDTLLVARIAFNNFGKYPIKILRMNGLAATKTVPPKFEAVYDSFTVPEFTYISYDKPYAFDFIFNSYDKEDIELIKQKKYLLYSWGFIEYENLATKKIMQYKYMVMYYSMFRDPQLIPKYLINENIEVKTKKP